MSIGEHAWEWMVMLGSWVVVPLMIVGFGIAILIELRRQRKAR